MRAAEGGYVPALAFVAMTMEDADIYPENLQDANYYWQLAAEQGFDCSALDE